MSKRANEQSRDTESRAVFMVGGPGSGKSYVRRNKYAGMKALDADDYKQSHPDYDPKNPAALHEWSAAELRSAFHSTIASGESFVYDGTGSTAERYVSYIQQAHEMGYTVEVCYVRVPMGVALFRNARRERTVPEYVVREKHALVGTSFEIIAPHADTVTVVQNG